MMKRHLVFVTPLLVVVATNSGCRDSDSNTPVKEEPAHVARHIDETDLNTITLSPRAAQRLGIRLAEVKLTEVQRQRTVGGEVMLPPGRTIVVSAPLAGTLSAPEGGDIPAPGSHVQERQPIFNFKPLLTPERDVLTPAERVRVAQTKADVATAQIEAERQIESTKIAVEAAQIAYDRALQLLENKAGSQRSVDEADAALRLAREAYTTAQARYAFLSEIELDEEAGELESRVIESPVAGILQGLDAAAGETVSAGELLFSVITMDRVWVRVPVYVGQWRGIDTSQPAQINEYGRHPGDAARPAQFVSAPPSANADSTTVDIYYRLDNQDGRLYPGQKLAVTLPLKGQAESLVAPIRAVLYDIHGGAWVYEQLGEYVYARRRVSVEYVDGQRAVLAAGPPAGAQVVTDGAAELFGTEFGVGH